MYLYYANNRSRLPQACFIGPFVSDDEAVRYQAKIIQTRMRSKLAKDDIEIKLVAILENVEGDDFIVIPPDTFLSIGFMKISEDGEATHVPISKWI